MKVHIVHYKNKIHDFHVKQKEYPMFAYSVKWQIRTDFERRSSKENHINAYLSFLWDADPVTRPEDETHMITVGELMDQFEVQRGIANQAGSQKSSIKRNFRSTRKTA